MVNNIDKNNIDKENANFNDNNKKLKSRRKKKVKVVVTNTPELNKKVFDRAIELNKKSGSKVDIFLGNMENYLQELCNSKIPFTKISKAIKEVYSYDLDSSTIQKFCKKKGFYKPKPRKTTK